MSSARLYRMTLFILNAERIDDAGNPFGILVDKFLESVAAQKNRRPAELFQSRFPSRGFRRALVDFDQRVALLRRDARRAKGAAPIGQLNVDGLFSQRGISFDFLWARHRERAH